MSTLHWVVIAHIVSGDVPGRVSLWDSYPEGQVGLVIHDAPKKQHGFLMGYFSTVAPAKCMADEWTKTSMPPDVLRAEVPKQGLVILARYVDTICSSIVDVPSPVHRSTQGLLGEVFHHPSCTSFQMGRWGSLSLSQHMGLPLVSGHT